MAEEQAARVITTETASARSQIGAGVARGVELATPVVREQVETSRRWTGEERLMAAVLEDALSQLERVVRIRPERALTSPDLQWIRVGTRGGVFSYRSITEQLRIDGPRLAAEVERCCEERDARMLAELARRVFVGVL